MKILLTTLNSKYVHSNLALRYLYSAAKKQGRDAELREFTINNEMGYVYSELVRGGYDVICFSCYIWNIEKTKELAADIAKACPDTLIVLGGPEVSFDGKAFLEENPWADMIICGEGEDPFAKLVCALEGEQKLETVPSLIYRRGGEVLENAVSQPLPMEKLPFPYEILPPEPDKVIYYESSRGCPYRCSYCISSLEKTVRPLPIDRVFEELSYFLSKSVKQVKFIDRTFNYDRERAKTIWEFLIDKDNGVTNFHFEICAELLDSDLLELLSKARKGLFQLEIGIQSLNEKALAAVDRSPQTAGILDSVKTLVEFGNIHVHVDLIAGLPYEDYSSFGRSFDGVYALGADNLQLGFLKLLKGTKIRAEADEMGYVFRDKAPYEIIANRWLRPEELVRLKMIENVLDLYANKGGFERSLNFLIEKTGHGAFDFFERLAEFFYEEGFQHRSHKKEDLYRILSKFAESVGAGDSAKSLLCEDLEATMNFDAVKKFHKKGWEII